MRLSLLEGILAAAAGVLLVVAGVQTWRASHYAGKVELLEDAVQGYAGAQATNLATIGRQSEALADWKAACTPSASQAAALAALRAELARTKADLAASRSDRKVIYERDPDARAWGDTGMPAAIADQLFPDPDRPH